jgi:RimJ/RimL family protein N-acetyltransferase
MENAARFGGMVVASPVVDTEILLRPVTEGDLVVLDRFLVDPNATGAFQWYGWRDPARWRRAWAENGLLTDEGGHLMVARGGDPLGFVAWRHVRTGPHSYCWNVGINLLPEGRGHGYGTQAQRELVVYLFSHTPVQRIEANTDVKNVPEQRALEKAGFVREGVLRGHNFRGGRWHDTVIYSVLRDEVEPH